MMSLPSHLLWTKPGRFPHPDWERISQETREEITPETRAWWEAVSRLWGEEIKGALGGDHAIWETDHFMILARENLESLPRIMAFLEGCFRRIATLLPYSEPDQWVGKCLVIFFADHDDFCEYVADYFEEDGEYAMMGGIYLNRGYGHFALPYDDMGNYEAVISHELCHACLAQFNLPVWLNEAITAEVEHHITGRNPYIINREIIREHRAYWDAEKLRSFWSGESFSFPDEGSHLSYHLCRYVLSALSLPIDSEHMAAFVRAVNYEDSGFRAAKELLDEDLQEPVSNLLEDDR